jgi:hypothetical protein
MVMKERVGEQDWSREEDDEVLREREGGKVDKGEVEVLLRYAFHSARSPSIRGQIERT